MIQLNLLPDVKLEYIKAQKLRSLVTSISVIVAGIAITILVLLFIVSLAQKKDISDHKNTIANYTNELEGKANISSILTVQNQLNSLGGLYSGRPAGYKLFDTYLNEVTPEAVSLNALSVDFNLHTLTLTGTADSLATVNQYVDTLKLTTYGTNGTAGSLPAFTNVVLSSFGVSSQSQNPSQAANFTISLNFTPVIFQSGLTITLGIPSTVVTHYEQSDESSLFKAAPTTTSTTTSTGGH
jgi:hypothetical protein